MTRSDSETPGNVRQQRTVLLATDHKNSVLADLGEGKNNRVAHSVYGFQSAEHEVVTKLGFNGELREAHDWYFLGNGYRVYSPKLMRFHSPDSWSPFGKGGLNAYVYCAGDPVNFSDPTGHIRTVNSLLGQRAPLPPPVARPVRVPVANTAPPIRTHSLPRTSTDRTPLDPPPPYVKSELPSYDEAAALRMHARLNQSSLPQATSPSWTPYTHSTSQRGRGFIMTQQNFGSTERRTAQPAQFTIHTIESVDTNTPPLPPPRRISENVERQYRMTQNPDGTWSHSSVEMVNLVRRGR